MKVAKELFADYVKEKKLRYFYTFKNKLSVQFIISSLRLRLIIPTWSLIDLDIKKTSSNNCLIWYYQKPEAFVCFCQKFLISYTHLCTYRHLQALRFTYMHLPALLSPVYALSPSPACTYLHLHASTFTCIHLHSLACTYIHLYALTFTCMHLPSLVRS